MCNYTALFNLLDMPAGVLPATTVTTADGTVQTRSVSCVHSTVVTRESSSLQL